MTSGTSLRRLAASRLDSIDIEPSRGISQWWWANGTHPELADPPVNPALENRPFDQHPATENIDADTLRLTLEALRDFTARHFPDQRLLELDAADAAPVDDLRAMYSAELGMHLLFLPVEYGGMGGGAFDVYRVCAQLAGVDVGIAVGMSVGSLGSDVISRGGTEAQRTRWLSRIAADGLLMAYAATEPEAGSDLGALKTVAEPVLEAGAVTGYRLTGKKQWISNGGIADHYSVLANAPGGPTWFIVDAGAPGFEHGKPENKHGLRTSNTTALFLDGVSVGADRRVGDAEGQGLLVAQTVFGYSRLMVAALGLGAGWAALDRAIAYARTRVQAGGPLSEKQGYTHKLIVPNAVRLEAARALLEESAERIDAGEGALNTEGAVAKLMATVAGHAAADASIQALGGYGYTRDFMVEKIARDVRITRIFEGTSEIMEMTIARDRWQLHLKTGGRHYHEQAAAMEAVHGGASRGRGGRGGARVPLPRRDHGAASHRSPHPAPARALPPRRLDRPRRVRRKSLAACAAGGRRPDASQGRCPLHHRGSGGDRAHLRP